MTSPSLSSPPRDFSTRKRELILDCETTGRGANTGGRIVEIAAIELIDGVPTKGEGGVFYSLVEPECAVLSSVVRIHGIDNERLRRERAPKFGAIASALLAFLGDDRIIAHNAAFDRGFVNAELRRAGRSPIAPARFFCTVKMARVMGFKPCNLNALCQRFDIDLSPRAKHGALVDCELLAQVYLKLLASSRPRASAHSSY